MNYTLENDTREHFLRHHNGWFHTIDQDTVFHRTADEERLSSAANRGASSIKHGSLHEKRAFCTDTDPMPSIVMPYLRHYLATQMPCARPGAISGQQIRPSENPQKHEQKLEKTVSQDLLCTGVLSVKWTL